MATRILRRSQLRGLALMLGVRHDWHEPDEQGVTAEVHGESFDNAGFWPEPTAPGGHQEMHVVIKVDGEEVATINLATLLAWASGLED